MKNPMTKSSSLKDMTIVTGLILLGLNAHGQSIQRTNNIDGAAQQSSNNLGARQALRISGLGRRHAKLPVTIQKNTGGQARLGSNFGRPEQGKPRPRMISPEQGQPRPWMICGNDPRINDPYWTHLRIEREIDTIKHILSLDIDDRSTKYLKVKIKELESRTGAFGSDFARPEQGQPRRPRMISPGQGIPLISPGQGIPLSNSVYWTHPLLEREIDMIKHILSLGIDDMSTNYLTDKLKKMESKRIIKMNTPGLMIGPFGFPGATGRFQRSYPVASCSQK